MAGEKVVIHLKDRTLKKGYLKSLDEEAEVVEIERTDGLLQGFHFDDIKAVFFVKDFEGKKHYREKKGFSSRPEEDLKRVYIKFFDKEALWGYIQGPLPWQKGFYLDGKKTKGLFVYPVDQNSNNEKVYVVLSSVEDLVVL